MEALKQALPWKSGLLRRVPLPPDWLRVPANGLLSHCKKNCNTGGPAQNNSAF
jgi:hypothetical protein